MLTQKGRGYPPAEDDDVQNLHDFKVPSASGRTTSGVAPVSYSDAFTRAMLDIAEKREDVFAITAAMAGPTGLLPFQARYPDRFFDVGIAEQHAVTAAAGMAMAGLQPVVAVYSTFFSRAFDQANLDVGLHRLPVVFFLDRAGITGDDGPSHHGVLDLSLTLVDPEHDGVRAFVRARGAGHARAGPRPRRSRRRSGSRRRLARHGQAGCRRAAG